MDDDTIDTLREIVQDMTQTVDLISSGAKGGNTLIHFLEEMLKTIEAWAAKYDVLLDDESLGHKGSSSLAIGTSSIPGAFSNLTQDEKDSDYLQPSLDGAHMDVNNSMNITVGKLGEDQRETELNLQSLGNEGELAPADFQASSGNRPSSRIRGGAGSQKATVSKELVEEMETGGALVVADPTLGTSTQVGNIVTTMASAEAVAREASERKVVDSPDWLPMGWITQQKTRETGNTAGTKDKYFFDPVSKRRFRSKKEVLAFLNRGNKLQMSDGRPKRLARKEKGIDQNISTTRLAGDISQEKSTNETVKLNVEHQESLSHLATDASEHPIVTASLPPDSSGSLISNQPGQPSEWLVYENLANLPYPMYDHMPLTENSASKGNTDSVPLAPWPSLFGNNDGLKRPILVNKSDDDRKLVISEEREKTKPEPKRAKKTARKNAS